MILQTDVWAKNDDDFDCMIVSSSLLSEIFSQPLSRLTDAVRLAVRGVQKNRGTHGTSKISNIA